MHTYQTGDIVFVPRGQKTNFFEVDSVNEDELTMSDGWVQITRNVNDVVLICKKENRQDLLTKNRSK